MGHDVVMHLASRRRGPGGWPGSIGEAWHIVCIKLLPDFTMEEGGATGYSST